MLLNPQQCLTDLDHDLDAYEVMTREDTSDLIFEDWETIEDRERPYNDVRSYERMIDLYQRSLRW